MKQHNNPVIGITADISGGRCQVSCNYVNAVVRAGGVPLILPPVEDVHSHLNLCQGFVLSGGDDPAMELFRKSTHPQAERINPDRQKYEMKLLELLLQNPEIPVLGVCLGMQLMALCTCGDLHQYLPDVLPTHADHWGDREHEITGELGQGSVLSNHRQAVSDPGELQVAARAHDGVIEAVKHPYHKFFLGVQWHPERTPDPRFGDNLFKELVKRCL